MIATITLNPSLDEHIMVHGLMVEETNRWIRLRRYAGGTGIDDLLVLDTRIFPDLSKPHAIETSVSPCLCGYFGCAMPG